MSGDGLVITGGGSYAIETDDQLARVERLEAFADTAHTIIDQLFGVSGSLTEGELRAANAPISALTANDELQAAIATLAHAAARAEITARLTRVAMGLYGTREHAIERNIDQMEERIAWLLGHVGGPAIVGGLVLAVGAMGTISPGVDGSGSGQKEPGWQKFLEKHPRLLNNPVAAEEIRLLVDQLDDAMLGAGGAQESTAAAFRLGGVKGPALAAAILVALGRPMGKLTESRVALAGHTSVTGLGSAPTTWADRIARIPDTAHNGGYQIRIDRFVDAGGRRSFEVYLSGTQTFSTSKTGTPFDFTSDVGGLTGLPNGAVTSVEMAMRAAGITASDPVNITGHSEGGLVAHEVAASGRWNVRVALEAGSPAAHTAVPAGTTEIALQHDEDVVPSLGGLRDESDRTIVVHATAFPEGSPLTDGAVPAHDSGRYEHTAAVLDTASSSMITEAKEKANWNEKGSTTVTTTLYKAVRVRDK